MNLPKESFDNYYMAYHLSLFMRFVATRIIQNVRGLKIITSGELMSFAEGCRYLEIDPAMDELYYKVIRPEKEPFHDQGYVRYFLVEDFFDILAVMYGCDVTFDEAVCLLYFDEKYIDFYRIGILEAHKRFSERGE